jgi:hypothetical protein
VEKRNKKLEKKVTKYKAMLKSSPVHLASQRSQDGSESLLAEGNKQRYYTNKINK